MRRTKSGHYTAVRPADVLIQGRTYNTSTASCFKRLTIKHKQTPVLFGGVRVQGSDTESIWTRQRDEGDIVVSPLQNAFSNAEHPAGNISQDVGDPSLSDSKNRRSWK